MKNLSYWQVVLMGTAQQSEFAIEEILKEGVYSFLQNKAGFEPKNKAVVFQESFDETSQICSHVQATDLQFILKSQDSYLMREWVVLANKNQIRIAGELLPLFFEVCQEMRFAIELELLYRVIGKLGAWMLAQKPAWAYWKNVSDTDWKNKIDNDTHHVWSEAFSLHFLDWFASTLYCKQFFQESNTIFQHLYHQIPPYLYERILPKWDGISEDLYKYHHQIQDFLQLLRFRNKLIESFHV